jgi:hypothetical protein
MTHEPRRALAAPILNGDFNVKRAILSLPLAAGQPAKRAMLSAALVITNSFTLVASGQTIVGNLQATAACDGNPPPQTVSVNGLGAFTDQAHGACLDSQQSTCSQSDALIEALIDQGSLMFDLSSVAKQFAGVPEGCVGGAGADAMGTIFANDVVFTKIGDPHAPGNVTFSMNLVLEGMLAISASSIGSAAATGSVQSSVGAPGSMVLGSNGLETFGALIGYPNNGSAFSFTTSSTSASLGQPNSVSMTLSAGASAAEAEAEDTSQSSSATSLMLRLPIGAPAFNLPAGFTANSVHLNVVDNIWMGAPGPEGDLDGDGAVNGSDLGLLLAAWGTNDPSADLNGDGFVDGADLGILLGAWTG